MEPQENPTQTNLEPSTLQPSLFNLLFGGLLVILSLTAIGAMVYAYAPPTTPQEAAVVAAVEPSQDYFSGISIQAKSVYILDIATDRVLYELNPTLQLPLASITKVPLILAIGEVIDPESTVTISRDAVIKTGGGLTAGEVWRARDLMDYTLMASSNTGAEALAEAADAALHTRYPETTPGRAAVDRMNASARALELTETYFLNASGLDESMTQAGALGSARDIARLFSYAARTYPDFFSATRRPRMEFYPFNVPSMQVENTNDALASIPGLIVGKTGFTDLAGGNLAVVFEAAPERPVAIVVLGSTYVGRFEDMVRLVEASRKAVTASK